MWLSRLLSGTCRESAVLTPALFCLVKGPLFRRRDTRNRHQLAS